MSYACAGSRFLIYEKEAFTMFKGDNKHIGDIEESFEGYHTHYTSFNSSYNVFLFSDGFQDQFGGPKDKKYSFRRLLELLESNINLPLDEQQKMIEADFNLWIGDNQQTDDVSIISVKRNL
jgi:serine phosphatase RsbU (regulator of sigma subunit)